MVITRVIKLGTAWPWYWHTRRYCLYHIFPCMPCYVISRLVINGVYYFINDLIILRNDGRPVRWWWWSRHCLQHPPHHQEHGVSSLSEPVTLTCSHQSPSSSFNTKCCNQCATEASAVMLIGRGPGPTNPYTGRHRVLNEVPTTHW